MSTKIYNGYSLPLMGILELMTFLDKVKSKIIPIHANLWSKALAKHATGLIDLNALGNQKALKEVLRFKDATKFNPKWEAYEDINNRIKKVAETKLRDPEIDFGFNICLIPTKTKILALLYTEQKEMTKAWESFKCVKSYYYFNNSDRPEEISAAAWKKRDQEWDAALGADGIPGNKSLQYHPISDFFAMPAYEVIKPYIPSFDKRVSLYASDNAFVEFCESGNKEIKDKVIEKRFISLIFDFDDYKKTAAGKKLLEKHTKQIKAKLKKRLVKSDFIDEVQLCN